MRVVGIGASAGGLAALEDFFQHTPANTGAAFVVVQHLAATRHPLLVELLQRVTSMPVVQACDAMVLQANQVHVIPPDAELSLRQGVLHVRAPSQPQGLRLPIDVLFDSLAHDLGPAAIGVVLSGMGQDGTRGLQAIAKAGGLTLVQAPASAQFDGMPRSAMAALQVDEVASPDELPTRLLSRLTEAPASPLPTGQERPIAAILSQLHRHTRHDFSQYKPSTLHRRIDRRLAIHGLRDPAAYAQMLTDHPQEIDLLFKELLIGVTQFFRDDAVWQQLIQHTLPALLGQRGDRTEFRAWVAGCSTGEEAYSLAIAFREVIREHPEHEGCKLQIFATDLSADAIATARAGRYPAAIDRHLPPSWLARHFTTQGDMRRVHQDLRDSVIFAPHDVLLDPPFTRLDVLCCRNLLIYFDAALQQRLLPLFHYSLRPGGLLLLGSSETIGPFERLFEPVDARLRLYRRRPSRPLSGELLNAFPPLSHVTKEFAVSTPPPPSPGPDSLQTSADRVLLQVHAPPAVVVNAQGDIVYISGRTGKYLEPAAGKANWNFHAMVKDSLREPLAQALREVIQGQGLRQLNNLPLMEGQTLLGKVDVTLQPLSEPAALRHMVMVVFKDQPQVPARSRRKSVAHQEEAHQAELQGLRDEIVSLKEQARIAREELQSTTEELQSINEELQSANEELTTSKEEMQSMNEELQTVNAEMQTRLDDLALAQSDMANLLNSTDIAMLFLDQDLNVRRYTDRATRIISLRETDIGRPMTDLRTSLRYPTLQDDVQSTMRTLVFSEKQIESDDGRWFTVKILPYRRLDNVIDGTVITLVDITATKLLEHRLREGQVE